MPTDHRVGDSVSLHHPTPSVFAPTDQSSSGQWGFFIHIDQTRYLVPDWRPAECVLRDVIFFALTNPSEAPKVFLLDLLGSHLAKSGLATRAAKC